MQIDERKYRRKRHWYDVWWEGEVYVACDFPGGVLISMSGWEMKWWRRQETQFVPGYYIDHNLDPLRLVRGLADDPPDSV